MEWLCSRAEARVIIESWRCHPNEDRPNSSLGYRTPKQFKDEQKRKSEASTHRFLGKRIRVKEGTARLAQSLRRVVIPVVVRTSLDAPDHVVAGEPLVAPRDTEGRQRMMQSIYNALAAEVEKDPVPWEFAFCLHRWMVADAAPGFPLERGLDEDAPMALLPQHVTLFERDRHQYWVHVGSQMAYRLPDWAYGLHGRLREGPKTARALSHEYSAMGIDASDLGRLLESLVQRRLLAVAGP